MAHKIIETTQHDYDPVNKYIDEKARLRRTKSVWGYTKAIALFLIALGIFLVLAAYAYHIFKKPYDKIFVEDNTIQSNEKIKNKMNEEIIEKEDKIENLEKQLDDNPENEKLKKDLENTKKELEKLKTDKENVVYNKDAVIFEYNDIGEYTITTGFQWDTVDDLRYGKKYTKDWCYLRKDGTTLDYYFDTDNDQTLNLKSLNLSKNEANKYKKYCAN